MTYLPYMHMGPCTQVEVAKRAGQEVVSSGAGTYYVKDVTRADGRRHEVLLEQQKCCNYVVMHKQPYRHFVCVFHKEGLLGHSKRNTMQTIRKFWPKYFYSDNYLKMYEDKTIRQPEIYAGKYVGPEHLRVGSPVQRPKKRGRPKTARYRSKRRTVKDVRESMGPLTHAYYLQVLEHF